MLNPGHHPQGPKKALLYILGAIIGLMALLQGEPLPAETGGTQPKGGEYIWSKSVEGSFEEVFENVSSSLASLNFPVVNVRDYKKIFAERFRQTGGGKMPFQNYRIIEFCNLTMGIEALSTDLRTGIFMPCRMVLFQENGKSLVTLMTVNPKFITGQLENPKMAKFAERLEKVILEVFDSALF